LIMLPLFILFFLPGGSIATGLLFWMLAFLSVLLVWFVLGRPADDGLPAFAGPRRLELEEQPGPIRRHMNVDEAVEVPPGVRIFRGTLRQDAQRAFDSLKAEVGPEIVPLVQPDAGGRTSIVLLPKPFEEAALERPVRPWLHWLLFGLTFLTTTFAGREPKSAVRRSGRRAACWAFRCRSSAIFRPQVIRCCSGRIVDAGESGKNHVIQRSWNRSPRCSKGAKRSTKSFCLRN
jgi:hypothetical protein